MLQINNKIYMFYILKAIELASKGFDISTATYDDIKSTWWNAKSKAFQGKITDNVPEVYLELTPDAVDIFNSILNGRNLLKRNKDKMWETVEEFPEGVEKITITSEIVYNAIVLLRSNFANFNEFDKYDYDAEYRAEMDKADKLYNPLDIPVGDFMTGLDRDSTRKCFRTLSALANLKDSDYLKELNKAFEDDADFSVLPESFRQFKVVDNRMYIPFKPSWKRGYSSEGSYIVLSKNPYDFYFCSYGSAFQSCFALNSPHGGWRGAVANSIYKGCFMVYITKPNFQKVSLTGEGKKYPAPYMFCRAWCWVTKNNKLCLDKVYSPDRDEWTETLEKSFCRLDGVIFKSDTVELIDSEGFKRVQRYRKYWYPDSLSWTDSSPVKFDFDSGLKHFVGTGNGDFLESTLRRINKVSDTIDITKPLTLSGGHLYNPKICPITGLLIDDSEETSPYAKQFSKPLTGGLVVLTYIDGFIRVDAMSDRCSCTSTHYVFINKDFTNYFGNCSSDVFNANFLSISTPLQTIKENLKNDMKEYLTIDTVLLRVINGSQVSWIKFRKDK